jgi:hypothetical protein
MAGVIAAFSDDLIFFDIVTSRVDFPERYLKDYHQNK